MFVLTDQPVVQTLRSSTALCSPLLTTIWRIWLLLMTSPKSREPFELEKPSKTQQPHLLHKELCIERHQPHTSKKLLPCHRISLEIAHATAAHFTNKRDQVSWQNRNPPRNTEDATNQHFWTNCLRCTPGVLVLVLQKPGSTKENYRSRSVRVLWWTPKSKTFCWPSCFDDHNTRFPKVEVLSYPGDASLTSSDKSACWNKVALEVRPFFLL